jgi:hypothetical protein
MLARGLTGRFAPVCLAPASTTPRVVLAFLAVRVGRRPTPASTPLPGR